MLLSCLTTKLELVSGRPGLDEAKNYTAAQMSWKSNRDSRKILSNTLLCKQT